MAAKKACSSVSNTLLMSLNKSSSRSLWQHCHSWLEICPQGISVPWLKRPHLCKNVHHSSSMEPCDTTGCSIFGGLCFMETATFASWWWTKACMFSCVAARMASTSSVIYSQPGRNNWLQALFQFTKLKHEQIYVYFNYFLLD